MTGRILVPDEDGVLQPQDFVEIPLSENEKALSLASNSGGSGEGMSHYSQASRCGRRARLSTARYKSYAENGAALPATKNHFVIGSVMHLLHELSRQPRKNLTLDYNEQFKNPNVAEGARLYRGWMRHHGRDFYGETLAVEEHIADTTTFAPHTVTAAIDMVARMDRDACDRLSKWGLDLEPGIVLVDWKSADSPSDGTNYKEGLQALWYLHAWNKAYPELEAHGIIFDVTMKRSRRKDRTVLREDFQKFYIPYGLENVEALRGMVEQGARNIELDVPNRSECCDWRGSVCAFRLNGECDARN